MSTYSGNKSPDASAQLHASQDSTIEDDIQTLNTRMNRLEDKFVSLEDKFVSLEGKMDRKFTSMEDGR